MPSPKNRFFSFCMLIAVAGIVLVWRANRNPGDVASAAPTRIETEESDVKRLSMSEVLDMAAAARQHMAENLDDYTARFVKQEVDTKGVLGGVTEIFMKVQTRLRGDTQEAPMRVYLRFDGPESVKGREVIWGEDLFEGKLAVHETGLLLSLKTLWLDPKGLLAMQGQRYPISEIGMVRLVEKLIERGEKDRNNPDITVTVTPDETFGTAAAELIQVHRARPSGGEDDFSLAEIVIDQQRQLILSYRSFGWPTEEGGEAPLLESYNYHDVEINVGLSDADFDVDNPEYNFPTL